MEDFSIQKTREVYRIKYGDSRMEIFFYPKSLGYEILRIRIEKDKEKVMEEFAKFYVSILIIERLICSID